MVTTILPYKGEDTLFITVKEVVQVISDFRQSVINKKVEELQRVKNIEDLLPVIRKLSNDLTIADYDYFLFLIDDLLIQMRRHLEKQKKTYEKLMRKKNGVM